MRIIGWAAVLVAATVFSANVAEAQCLAANKWAWGSCGGGGGNRGGGGGGGNYAAAAVGAGNVAIGLLNMAIAAAEQQQRAEQHAANEAARRRFNHCQGKYRQAYATNEQARRLSESGKPQEAYVLFERALNTLGSCGQRADLGKLRGNLEHARQTYASLINPNVADTTIYGKTEAGPPRLVPALLEKQARDACVAHADGSPDWQSCMATRKAELVIASNPSIRNACQSLADRAERQQCVFNRYWADMLGKDSDQFGDKSNCYYDEHGKPCHPGGRSAAVAPKTKPEGESELRKELRRRLNALPDRLPNRQPSSEDISNMETARDALPPGPDRDQLTAAIDKAKAGPEKSLNEQAYDNYMQGRDGQLGQGVNVGVPENGSFANDLGGDKLLGSSVPSNR